MTKTNSTAIFETKYVKKLQLKVIPNAAVETKKNTQLIFLHSI